VSTPGRAGDESRGCRCQNGHAAKRIVVTGGPGAGKTAVLELLRRALCSHVLVLPEAAGIVFSGGFPRRATPPARRAAQRAIFCIQRELEAWADSEDPALVLCDRGVVDGVAYWPGPEDFWSDIGMSRRDAFARYDLVIHLRVPAEHNGYHRLNPLRVETAEEARAIDDRIAEAWQDHPRRLAIEATADFMEKANRALEIIRHELPECCRPETDSAPGNQRRGAPLEVHTAVPATREE
jgi:predicted ATPase